MPPSSTAPLAQKARTGDGKCQHTQGSPEHTSKATRDSSDDDADEDLLLSGGPIFTTSCTSSAKNKGGGHQLECVRERIARRSERKAGEQLAFLDAIVKDGANRKKRIKRDRPPGRKKRSERAHACATTCSNIGKRAVGRAMERSHRLGQISPMPLGKR